MSFLKQYVLANSTLLHSLHAKIMDSVALLATFLVQAGVSEGICKLTTALIPKERPVLVDLLSELEVQDSSAANQTSVPSP